MSKNVLIVTGDAVERFAPTVPQPALTRNQRSLTPLVSRCCSVDQSRPDTINGASQVVS